MVLMKGTKRVFETPAAEDTSSTASARAVTLYGVTSYDDIINSLIHIRALVGGTEGVATININNLGAKSVKIYKSGMKQNLPGNWVSIGQIYTIYYDGTDFVLDGNYDRIDSSDIATFEMNLDDFLSLTESSTSAQITEVFGGEEGLQKFKTALNYGTISAFRSSEDSTITYTCILRSNGASINDFDMVRFVGQGSEDDTIDASTEITLMFMIGEGNTYSKVIKSEKNLFDTAPGIFEIPVEVLSLSSKSTAADITAALGGADNVALFEQAILNKAPLTVAQAGNEYFRIDVNNLMIQLEQSGNETVVTSVILEMINIAVPSIIVLTLAKSDKTASFDTADLVKADIASTHYVDSKIETASKSMIQDLPEQIYTWAFGDGTSYPPETPDADTLTAYMTSEVQDMLDDFVTNGTILKAANILSGADRKSYYNALYLVNRNYDLTRGNCYEYYFNNISGSNNFYIYYHYSASKWYWNNTGEPDT